VSARALFLVFWAETAASTKKRRGRAKIYRNPKIKNMLPGGENKTECNQPKAHISKRTRAHEPSVEKKKASSTGERRDAHARARVYNLSLYALFSLSLLFFSLSRKNGGLPPDLLEDMWERWFPRCQHERWIYIFRTPLGNTREPFSFKTS